MDDFGTGYSSLAYLKLFPMDFIKVDRTIVAGLEQSPGDAAIMSATLTMAHSFGLEVIAEGVETREELAELQSLGCDMGQGYHWREPLPAEEAALVLIG